MTARFPPEIFDLIIDHLHGDRNTLKQCSLVSKSWVPRTQKHLFSEVRFGSCLQLGNLGYAFPDSKGSPTRHTDSLDAGDLPIYAPAYCKLDHEWLRSLFPNVTRFHVTVGGTVDRQLTDPHCLQFHRLFPAVTSLSLTMATVRPADLAVVICSFPVLEDLAMLGSIARDGGVDPRSNWPKCTGTLTLNITMDSVRNFLEGLPTIPLQFRQIICRVGRVYEGNYQPVGLLVERCSDTLEGIIIKSDPECAEEVSIIDFSKAKKLKEVEFQLTPVSIRWFTESLKTISSNNGSFKQISIRFPLKLYSKENFSKEMHREWTELDELLIRLSEPGKIHTKVICNKGCSKKEKKFMEDMLPRMAGEGRFELVVDDSDQEIRLGSAMGIVQGPLATRRCNWDL